jgi:hypothetical protein
MKPGGFTFTEECFLKLEEILAARRPASDDLWAHRVSLFCHLPNTPYRPKEKRFKLGLLSYSVWLLLRFLAKTPIRPITPPPAADFLVHIVGNVSKEVDTLVPVVAALRESGHSVLVLWGSDEPMPEQMVGSLNGATVWTISGLSTLAAFRPFLADEALRVVRLLWRTFWFLRPLHGARRALWKNSAGWFHDQLQYKCWKHLLATLLTNHHFKGVVVVSETAPSAEALCRLGARRGWPVHHLLHGTPWLLNTRTAATHIHCFSRVERDFFIEQHLPPSRIHALGSPRQSAFTQQIKPIRTVSPETGKLRILFASTGHFAGEVRGYDLAYQIRSLKTVFAAAGDAHLEPSEIRIRPHPNEDASTLLRMLATHAPQLGDKVVSRKPLSDDLAWANVVLTGFSTTAIEACYAGCFLIWLVFPGFPSEIRDRLIQQGYGHKAGSIEDLRREFERCRDPAIRSRLIQEFLETGRNLGILNENASGNIARVMAAQPPV